MKNYLISGVSMRSKGGSAMILSAARLLGQDQAQFSLISFYPELERRALTEIEQPPRIRIVPAYLCRWRQLAFKFEVGLMALDLLASSLCMPSRLRLSRYARELTRHAAVLEIHGISFSEILGLNDFITSWLKMRLADLAGVDYLCLPQSYGPCSSRLGRWLARSGLESCRLILPRGQASADFVQSLGLKKPLIRFMPDLAFAYENPSADQVAALKKRYGIEARQAYVAIIPNMLFIAWNQPQVIEIYVELMRQLSAWRDYHFILLAHDQSDVDLDDREFNRRIQAAFPEHERLTLIEDQLSASDIKALIAACDLTICSRFHGMVSSLMMNVPPFVIGWGDKYREIMALFELEANVFDYRAVSAQQVFNQIQRYLGCPAALDPTLKLLQQQLGGLAALIDRPSEDRT